MLPDARMAFTTAENVYLMAYKISDHPQQKN
jgi:hypothetical protein